MPRPNDVTQLVRGNFQFANWESWVGRRHYFRVRNLINAGNHSRAAVDRSVCYERAPRVAALLQNETEWHTQTMLPLDEWQDLNPSQVRRAFTSMPQPFSKAVMSILCLELTIRELGIAYDIYGPNGPVFITPCTYYIPEVVKPEFKQYIDGNRTRADQLRQAIRQTDDQFFDDLNSGQCMSPDTAAHLHTFLSGNGYRKAGAVPSTPRYHHPCIVRRRGKASAAEFLI